MISYKRLPFCCFKKNNQPKKVVDISYNPVWIKLTLKQFKPKWGWWRTSLSEDREEEIKEFLNGVFPYIAKINPLYTLI